MVLRRGSSAHRVVASTRLSLWFRNISRWRGLAANNLVPSNVHHTHTKYSEIQGSWRGGGMESPSRAASVLCWFPFSDVNHTSMLNPGFTPFRFLGFTGPRGGGMILSPILNALGKALLAVPAALYGGVLLCQ